MAYQILARKYRPQRFSDVAGQPHVTRTLLNALAQGRIAHGYIFSGHRGIGKTTVARILGMALNCRTAVGSPERPDPEPCGTCVSCLEIRSGNSVDLLEIDAATNRGIDEIRELREAARYSPSRDRYKIYLLDEAHQITDAAFNALLKTLEEPPDHVVFMMATTQPEDIPQTIRSRCQNFSFHAVAFEDIVTQLRQISQQEQIQAEDGALSLLAESGDGSMRDALSIMDQAIASAPLSDGQPHLETEQIRELLGNIANNVFERMLQQIQSGQSAAVMEEADRLVNTGNGPSQIARQFVRYLRNCLMAKLGGETSELLQVSADERSRVARSAALFSEEDLTRFLQVMLRTFDELNYRQEQRFHLELGLMKLVHLERLIPIEKFLSGVPGAPAPSRPAGGEGPRGSSQPPKAEPPAPPSAASLWPATKAEDRVNSSGQQSKQYENRPVASPSSASQPAVQASTIHTPSSEPQTSPAKESIGAEEPTAAPKAPEADPHPEPGPKPALKPEGLDRARDAVVAALDSQGHQTAATLFSAANWCWDDEGAIRVEVGTKKTMLNLTMTAEAWKITRDALREIGAVQKITAVPSESVVSTTTLKPILLQGSIQAAAMENPLVRKAQEIFHAEVRNIADLRETAQEISRKNH